MRVFLDLDSTLIYSYYIRDDSDSNIGVEYTFGIRTIARPGVHYFVHQLILEGHSVEVITYADLRYATRIIEGLNLPVERITSMRELNTPRNIKGNGWVLVDDMCPPDKLKLICGREDAFEHLIPIYAFTGDSEDKYLFNTLKVIRFIASLGGVDLLRYVQVEYEHSKLLEEHLQRPTSRLSVYENHASLWEAIMLLDNA